MTKSKLITLPEGSSLKKAKKLLNDNRIEKLPIVDKKGNLRGLITLKDVEKYAQFPNAAKDAKGRLMVGAALGVTQNPIEHIDDLFDGIHDVKQINYSLDSGLPLHYISSGIIRNVEGSIRVIVDNIKQKIKDEKLKPSRTKIILFWRIDEFEIRGDKTMILEKFVSKLEDIVGDVQILTDFSIGRNISQSTFSREKHNFVLLCSKDDSNYVNKHKNTIPSNSILVKANELLDIIQNK